MNKVQGRGVRYKEGIEEASDGSMRKVEKEKVNDGRRLLSFWPKGSTREEEMCRRGLLLSPFFRSVHTREGVLVKRWDCALA